MDLSSKAYNMIDVVGSCPSLIFICVGGQILRAFVPSSLVGASIHN